MKNEVKTTAHSSYRCEYHIVFAPKYRRKVIYGEIKADIGVILRKLCNELKVEILEADACPDHIHMLVSIPPVHEYSAVRGDAQIKECTNDLRQTRKPEVQIREQKFLVQRVLRGYGRQKRKNDPGIHPESVRGRSGIRPDQSQRVCRPVHG